MIASLQTGGSPAQWYLSVIYINTQMIWHYHLSGPLYHLTTNIILHNFAVFPWNDHHQYHTRWRIHYCDVTRQQWGPTSPSIQLSKHNLLILATNNIISTLRQRNHRWPADSLTKGHFCGNGFHVRPSSYRRRKMFFEIFHILFV